MPKTPDIPLKNIRENMERLIPVRGYLHDSGKHKGEPNKRKLALDAGIDPGTVSNLLDPEWTQAPLLKKIAAVADALGVTTWQLCMPNLPISVDDNGLLRDGLDEDTYRMAALFKRMGPEARKTAWIAIAFAAKYPDGLSESGLLRTVQPNSDK